MDERSEKLGFAPQKELVYNKLLHFSDKLDEESQKYLEEIKTNLGKSIFVQDFRDISLATQHLVKYIRLYGRKFSKEDHVHFIKVCFELILIPDVELSFVKSISVLLTALLKKVKLLSREDLELPWQPLFVLIEKILNSSYETFGMIIVPCNLEIHLKSLIRACNPYFPLEATQEILDEFRPWMCPFDSEMGRAMNYLETFLPTLLPPSEHHRGFKLWFEELIGLWQNWHNIPSWENHLLFLFSRLANDNIGYIDWEPYIPMIFTRLLRSFNLPGRASMVQVVRAISTFDTSAVATLLASMLGKGSICQLHINRLFKALESFYHPSNYGRWLIKMQRLLHKLPLAVIKRLHREKHQKPSWLAPIPEEAKLTDEEVTEFVNIVVPAALLSMFSKRGCADSAGALQNLGILRPELVVPQVLERLYSSLETLTEPHRLTAAMNCIVPICRSLVRKNKYYTEGPSHVVPLLMGALPGLDPNDIKKCMITFQFISTFATIIPFIDCSSAASNKDLPEHVQEVCLATSAFEDFVLQFMDRIFALIENSSANSPSHLDRESELSNPEEAILEVGLYSSFGIVMMQSSPTIVEAALNKLHSFIKGHIFEINVSGKYAANLCRGMCRVAPESGLKLLLPHFAKLVLALTESEEIIKEEFLDDELLFSLQILSQIARSEGCALVEYQDYIVKVLERTLKLTCKKGYRLACAILKHTLKSYLLSYPIESCSIPDPWNRYGADEMHLYLEDWGQPGDINNLGINYHIPSDKEINASKALLEMFVVPEIERLRSWSQKEITLPREIVHRSLNIVLWSLQGAFYSLPMWEEEQLKLTESSLPLFKVPILECGTKDIDLHGKNARQYICEALRQILGHINETCEDDTKSLFMIIQLYSSLMFNWGLDKDDFTNRWKSFSSVKNIVGDKLQGQKKYIRTLLIDRVHLQYELRLSERYRYYFTATHVLLMKDLLKLAVSHYSEIRKRAQVILQHCFSMNESFYKLFLPDILEILQKDPTECHEEFKGALYVILGNKQTSMLRMQDWHLVSELLPAIVSAKHSEKPSIIKMLGAMTASLDKLFLARLINFAVTENSLKAARCFWNTSNPMITAPGVTEDEVVQYSILQANISEDRKTNYLKLVNRLVDLLKNGSLHWRHFNLALGMLVDLVRPDVLIPAKGVELITSLLIHDTLAVRKLAVQGVSCVMKQQKQRHPKIVIDPTTQNRATTTLHPIMPKVDGALPENFWLQYNSVDPPDTEAKWNSRHFVHKTHWGFYSWPKSFEVYAPDSEQPKLQRTAEEMGEEERPIFEFFAQQKNVDSFIKLFSLEEKKDQDKFDPKKLCLYKGLFRKFGDMFLLPFLTHLDRMVQDKQESQQRCAAEIIAGLIIGSKHWDFRMTHRLKDHITPLLEKIIHTITPETLSDWSTCMAAISESRDPNKLYWLFEFFMRDPLILDTGSFLESSWWFLLLSLVSHQEWRVCELLHRALALILPKLDHAYQNVREKLGSLLVYIFMYDIPLNSKILAYTPQRVPFINSLVPKFSILETNKNGNQAPEVTEESPEVRNAKNLFLTVCRWISLNGSKTLYTAPPDMFQLLPVLCHMVNDTTDEGFQREYRVTIAILGQAFLNSESIDAVISTLIKMTTGNSWRSRVSGAAYLQTVVFSNLFKVMNNQQWIKDTYEIVWKLLQDEHVEVRESAAEALCGFLHCQYFNLSKDLLKMFKEKCQKKSKLQSIGNSSRDQKSFSVEEMRERHAGVLGLCACVNAFPYDVPEFLPEILVLLGDHLNDPQPISATIKKTLSSFRRTHHDNWRDHKLKFTDDQLVVITDLLVSPSYYA